MNASGTGGCLRSARFPGVSLVSYSDETLVPASEPSVIEPVPAAAAVEILISWKLMNNRVRFRHNFYKIRLRWG